MDNAKVLIDDDYKREDLDLEIDDEEEENNKKENEIYDKLKNAEEFDNVVKENKKYIRLKNN